MHGPAFENLISTSTAVTAVAINALWQDALLVAGVWLLLRAWPRLNAATRYLVWNGALVAAVIVPLATTLPFVSAPAQATPAATRSAAHEVRRPVVGAVASAARPVAVPVRSVLPRAPQRMHVTLPLPVALAVFAAWAVLAVLSLVRLAIGLAQLERLKRDALPLPVDYRDAMSRWTQANKGLRDVRLCVSDETDVPVAVGLFDAMILIPRVLLERLSETEVDQISLHELAHLRRADDWSNGLQRVLIALLAWNPAALFIAQQLDLEREVACDDWVLSLTGAVRPYAVTLTKMAETSSWPRHPIAAPGVFATRRHISLRIERLLRVGRNAATSLAPAPAAAAVALTGALAIVIAIVAPSVAAPVGAPIAATVAGPAVSPAAHVKQHRTRDVARHERVAIAQTAAPAAAPVATPSRAVSPAAEPKTVRIRPIHVHVAAQTIRVPGIDVDIPGVNVPVARVAQTAGSCADCVFSKVDWSGRDLHGVSYTGVDLSESKLVDTNFSGGNFSGVDFSKSDLRGANFGRARLVGVDFSGARLDGANFDGASLDGCDLSGVDLTHVDLSKAKLTGMDLSEHRSPP